MPEEEHDEVVPQGKAHDGHEAEEALHDKEAIRNAEAARPAENIAESEQLTPKQRAKQLRKLSDDELLAMAEEAIKADHWLDVARRSQAELDNTVKRLKREHVDDRKYAAASLVRDLLPVLDNLGRALQAASQGKDFEALQQGVALTNKMFIDTLSQHGIKPIEAAGQPFDPAWHEALMTTNNPDLENDVVAMELERGWKMLDRVLRATKVQVNKR